MSVGAISVVEHKDGLWRGHLYREASRSPSPDIHNSRRPSMLKLRRSASVQSEPRRRASSIVQFSLNGTTTSVVVEEAKHELARMLDAANSSAGKLNKKSTAAVPSELEECPICYEELECDGVREGFLTPCGHGFHYVCLFRYLRFGKDYKCPSCRANIRYLTLLAGGQKLPQAELHEILRSGPTDVVFVKPGLFGEDFGDEDGAEHASPPPADEGAMPSSEAVEGEELAAPEGTRTPAEDSPQLSPVKKPPAITCETVFLGDAMAEAGPSKKIREVVLPPVIAQLVDKEEHITSALELGYAVQLRATSLNRWFELIGNTTAKLDTDTCTFTMAGLTLRAKEKTGGNPPSFLNNKVTLRFEVDCETRGEDIELACDRAKLYGRVLFKKFPDTHLPLAASNGAPEHDECDEFSPSTFGTRSPTCTAHSGSPATAEARQMPGAVKVQTPPHTPTQVSHAPDTDPKRNGRPPRTHEPTAHSTHGRTPPKKNGGCACC